MESGKNGGTGDGTAATMKDFVPGNGRLSPMAAEALESHWAEIHRGYIPEAWRSENQGPASRADERLRNPRERI